MGGVWGGWGLAKMTSLTSDCSVPACTNSGISLCVLSFPPLRQDELAKCKRSISKRLPEAPHEVLLVLDGTTGLNMLNQVCPCCLAEYAALAAAILHLPPLVLLLLPPLLLVLVVVVVMVLV